MSEQRDLRADLEICNKAYCGPWTHNEYWRVENPETIASGGSICRAFCENNAAFIAAARTGWPEAIERAIKAEDKLEMFENECDMCKNECDMYKNECDMCKNDKETLALETIAALREANDLQRHSIQQLSAQVVGLQAVAEAANLILFWRGISETDDKKASDDWVKFLQDNGYWDRYDGCCNCSLCTKAREEYKKSVEKRLYEAVKAYREISQPDPGADLLAKITKLEAVAEAARKLISNYWNNRVNGILAEKLQQALAALEGPAHE